MKTVLVTGSSSGIGRATVRRLDRAGWRVFAGVRKEEDAAALREESSPLLEPLMLDVTDAGAIAAAAERIGAEPGGLDGLVDNAGGAVAGPLEALPIEDFRRQIELNLTAQLAVTQAMLPAIRTARGRIVMVSSVGGRVALPITGAYHAAKFGLEAIGDSLRQELAPWGIRVVLIEPGSIDTPIWSRGEEDAERIFEDAPPRMRELYAATIERYRQVIRETAERGIPAEKVAARIQHALETRRPRARYLIGIDAQVMARLKPLVPTPILDRAIARAMAFPKPPDPDS
ncbi:MAG TPA: SDR family oxidoreductase [Solirubrobacterales bacterium]|nr:SDR family oxidoreductase [Solirubrobacterales bacterium]